MYNNCGYRDICIKKIHSGTFYKNRIMEGFTNLKSTNFEFNPQIIGKPSELNKRETLTT
jgi:hypothetical protein